MLLFPLPYDDQREEERRHCFDNNSFLLSFTYTSSEDDAGEKRVQEDVWNTEYEADNASLPEDVSAM